jgi:hypothetical protein
MKTYIRVRLTQTKKTILPWRKEQHDGRKEKS